MSQLIYSELETPLGRLYIVSEGASVVEVAFERPAFPEGNDKTGASRQLKEYFSGGRFAFDIAINPGRLSGFYTAVYKALCEIPYGAVCSYKELAKMAGSPNAARAVGQAMSRNPIPIIMPCHRVTAADGSLGGYTGGIGIKKKLLDLERRYVSSAS
ncbi:MAG: methylated-DNA--[protein]-cysteine S-methyltransferase [Candidatus Magnetominusculus sp. LBB02]|nr:methylated-DNA--[protein]-cysteine S-methyltransferase [Candidatus Magnetominusculus sp. LBB02]